MWIDTPAAQLLALLIVGHLLGDFLLQGAAMARLKGRRVRVLAAHGGRVALAQLLLAWPFVDLRLVLGVLLLALLHSLVDRGRIAIQRRALLTAYRAARSTPKATRRPGDRCSHRSRATAACAPARLRLFFAEQALHLLLLCGLWQLWLRSAGHPPAAVWPVAATTLRTYTAAALVVGGYIVNGAAAVVVVRGILARFADLWEPSDDAAGRASRVSRNAMGRVIGVLERQIVYTLILLGQWGALGLVLAAKSVARYPEMKQRHFADYYLIGTLASLSVALASGVVVALALGRLKLPG